MYNSKRCIYLMLYTCCASFWRNETKNIQNSKPNMIVGNIEIVAIIVTLLFLIPVLWNIYKSVFYKKFTIFGLVKIFNKSLIIQGAILIFLIFISWVWNKANFIFDDILAGTLYTYFIIEIFMYLPCLALLNLVKLIIEKQGKLKQKQNDN